MTTDLHDTALPRFEDRLWSELSDVHRQRQRPAVVTPHRPNRRRRPLAIGAAVAVAAATTLVIGVATMPGGKPQPADASIEERVVAATEAALSDSVVHVLEDLIPSSETLDHETWYDYTTGTVRTRDMDDQGTVLWDNGPAEAPAPGDEAPDLSGHDPSLVEPSDCTPVPAGEAGAMAEECRGWDWPEGYPTRVHRWVQACDATYADVEEPFLPLPLEGLAVHDEVAAGFLVADGTEVIDGKELIRLRQTAGFDVPLSEQTVYVDPESYLPVELRSDMGGPDENVLRFEYLPRTAANMALLSPPVPEGYTQVDELTPCS